MSDLKHAETKIDGQRRAIREHIAKFERYPDRNDKRTAVKTVERAQNEITSIKRRHPRVAARWEDTWKPPGGWDRG